MSWNVQYDSIEKFNRNQPTQPIYPELTPESKEQLSAARIAAQNIIAVGVVGEGKDFVISLHGHANPDHEPASGYANDCVGLMITQKSAS